jgi:O-antigen ligase
MPDAADQIFNSNPASKITAPFAASPNAASFADRVALCLLLASVFFLPSDLRVAGGKSLVSIFEFTSLIFALFGMFKRRSWTPPAAGILLLSAFVVWSTCMLAWTPYPAEGIWQVLQYWRLLPLAWLVTQYAWSNRVRNQLYDAYVVGCWLGFIGLVQGVVSGSSYTSGDQEFEGRYSFGTDPNYLALALVIGIPFACQRAVSAESRWLRRAATCYVPAAALAVALTGSRGGLIALLVAACGYAIRSTARIRLLIFSVMAVLLLVTFSASFISTQRFQSIPQELESGTLSDRKGLWVEAIAVFEQNPLTGLGIGAPEGLLSIAAHNTALEVLMAGGMISFLLFYSPFTLAMVQLDRVRSSESKWLLVVCAVWLVGTMALSWDDNPISWFLFAILWSVPAMAQGGKVVAQAAHTSYDPAG